VKIKKASHFGLIGSSFANSFNIIGFKINKIFSKPLNIIIGLLFALIAFMAFVTPPYIVNTASQLMSNNSDFYKEFISGSFILVAANDGVDAVNLWLTGIIATIFIAPIVSNTLNSSYSKNLLFGVRRNMSYQISDSIILQFLSPLIITALVYTLFFASLLRYEYALPQSLTFIMVSIWLLSVFLFTLIGWVNEFFSRKYGIKYKIGYILFLLIFIYINFFMVEESNLFGLSNFASSFMRTLSVDVLATLALLGVLLMLMALIIWFIFSIGLKTLHKYPAPFKDKKYISESTNLTTNVVKILFRFDSIRVPILFMIVVLTAVFSFQSSDSVQTIFALSFILPLIFSLTMFVNIFGLVNSGNSWLAAAPKFRNKFLYYALFLNLSFVILSSAFITAPALIMGNISINIWSKFISLNILASLLTLFVALNHSYKKPSRYDFHVRGENIVPPGGALKLTGFMLVIAGFPTIIIGGFIPLPQLMLLIVIVFALLFISIRNKNKDLNAYGMNRIASEMG
jgi:hypothetical protein